MAGAEKASTDRKRNLSLFPEVGVIYLVTVVPLTPTELISGSKRRDVILARSYISFVAVKEEGLGLGDVARALNVSKQSILRGIAKERNAEG